MDEALTERWSDLELSQAITEARTMLLAPADTSTPQPLGVLDALLTTSSCYMPVGDFWKEETDPVLKSCAELVRMASTALPGAASVVLVHLPEQPDPRALLEVLPELLNLAPPALILQAVNSLRVLFQADSRLGLPVVDAMVLTSLSSSPMPSPLSLLGPFPCLCSL
jgi:hypothetical protein